MSKRAPNFEWQIAEDDRAWNELAQQPMSTAPSQRSVATTTDEYSLVFVSKIRAAYNGNAENV